MRTVDIDNGRANGQVRQRLNVLLVYEDLGAGVRARHAFERLLRRPELEIDPRFDLVNFRLLENASVRAHVAKAAGDEDIVALSAHASRELPQAVKSWMSQWLGLRRWKPCALVVFLDSQVEPDAVANRTIAYLQGVACQAGLAFFRQSQPARRGIPCSPRTRPAGI